MNGSIQKIKNFLLPAIDGELRAEVERINTGSMLMISLVGCLIEAIGLCAVLIFERDTITSSISFGSMSFCFICCALFHLLLRFFVSKGVQSHNLIKLEVFLLFGIISAWGMMVSYNHFRQGEQILTFYAVIICLICTIVLRPVFSFLLVSLPFGIFFFIMYRFNGAHGVDVFNYFGLMLFCIYGSLARYKVSFNLIKSKLEVKSLNAELHRAARTDIITDVKNRYALVDDASSYEGGEIILCVCDIDRFKRINDRYGHDAGDSVIKAVADVLVDNFGENAVYRYGGDEFVIVSESGKDEFDKKIDRVKSTLDILSVDGIDEKISCSFGSVKGSVSSEGDYEELFRKADVMMYADKRDGRG